MSALAAGFSMGASRLRARPAWLAALLGLALAVAAALVERSVTSVGAVDRALEATFGLVIPLCAFAAVSAATASERLRDAVWPLARYGGSARHLALGVCLAATLAASVVGATLAAVVVVASTGAGAGLGPVLADAGVSAWIGAITGAAYVGWFSLGAAFGRRGAVRWLPLVLDFTLGGSGGVLGAILPRGHVHALLGGATPLALPRSACTATLAVEAIVLLVIASARTGD